ncbi:MAG: hypothetical protein A2Y65_02825 [Deltaproteobacteria bacterium RBG_13_52_11]|nr:MAG: hypothetical protein A2Y65_02825 [Deltaproteobacteria bacterium RBG_13_52_11]
MKSRKDNGITRKQARAIVTRDARQVTEQDVENVLNKSEELRRRFETGGPLGKFVDDFKLLFAVVRDYRHGRYRKIPFWTIAAIVAGFLYVLNPFDLIPDFIPLVGQIDDAAVVAACLLMVRQDLHRYKKWKIENQD